MSDKDEIQSSTKIMKWVLIALFSAVVVTGLVSAFSTPSTETPIEQEEW